MHSSISATNKGELENLFRLLNDERDLITIATQGVSPLSDKLKLGLSDEEKINTASAMRRLWQLAPKTIVMHYYGDGHLFTSWTERHIDINALDNIIKILSGLFVHFPNRNFLLHCIIKEGGLRAHWDVLFELLATLQLSGKYIYLQFFMELGIGSLLFYQSRVQLFTQVTENIRTHRERESFIQHIVPWVATFSEKSLLDFFKQLHQAKSIILPYFAVFFEPKIQSTLATLRNDNTKARWLDLQVLQTHSLHNLLFSLETYLPTVLVTLCLEYLDLRPIKATSTAFKTLCELFHFYYGSTEKPGLFAQDPKLIASHLQALEEKFTPPTSWLNNFLYRINLDHVQEQRWHAFKSHLSITLFGGASDVPQTLEFLNQTSHSQNLNTWITRSSHALSAQIRNWPVREEKHDDEQAAQIPNLLRDLKNAINDLQVTQHNTLIKDKLVQIQMQLHSVINTLSHAELIGENLNQKKQLLVASITKIQNNLTALLSTWECVPPEKSSLKLGY